VSVPKLLMVIRDAFVEKAALTSNGI